MPKDPLLQLEMELKKQCLLLFTDPETDAPIFIELVEKPAKKAAFEIISMAERSVPKPWTRRLRQLLERGLAPDVVILSEELDMVTMDQWKPYAGELTVRLLEESGEKMQGTPSEGVVFSLDDGSETLVDEDRLAQIQQHRWRLRNPESETSIALHACKEAGSDCGSAAASLHRFVAEARVEQIVWHRKSANDNTRSSLVRCTLKPGRLNKDEIIGKIKALMTERAHRRGRPKKRHDWKTSHE